MFTVHEVHIRPVYISIHVRSIRAQEDYSETHESCFSLDEDANR